MSAAFDTVDHENLLSRLEQRFRMSGPALMWMRSYLSDRSQSVNVPGGTSSKRSYLSDRWQSVNVPGGTSSKRSYLSDRWQSVNVPGGTSSKSRVICGVCQGSALGLLLFSMCTAPIGDIIRRHKLSFHLYTDDTQLYIKFEMTDETNRLLSVRRIEHCINDVRVWMVANLLKVNDDKTVALVLAPQNTCVSTTKHLC